VVTLDSLMTDSSLMTLSKETKWQESDSKNKHESSSTDTNAELLQLYLNFFIFTVYGRPR